MGSKLSLLGEVYGWRKNLQDTVFNKKGDLVFKAMFKSEMRCAFQKYFEAGNKPISENHAIDKVKMLEIFRFYLVNLGVSTEDLVLQEGDSGEEVLLQSEPSMEIAAARTASLTK